MNEVPDERVPFNDLSRSWVTQRDALGAVESVVRSGWYVLGPQNLAFEHEMAEFLGVSNVVGVASGTDALALALQAVGCVPGDLVATVGNAAAYTSVAASQVGCLPVYVEVDEYSLLMSSHSLRDVLSHFPVKAVVLTHLYGNMVPGELLEICRAAGVAVVEDCAQAIGASLDGKLAGSFGNAAAFSFYPTKNLGGIGDGGAVAADDPAVAGAVRELRQYGWTDKYLVSRPGGRNSRLDEIQAAVLRQGLAAVNPNNARRRQIVTAYDRALVGGALRLVTRTDESSSAHLAVVRTPSRSVRESLRRHLRAHGVSTAIHYPIPDYCQPGLAVRLPRPLPHTDLACQTVLSLPCFPELTESEVDIVTNALRSFSIRPAAGVETPS